MGTPVSLPNPIWSSSNQSATLEAQPQGKTSSLDYPKVRQKSGSALCDTPDVSDDLSDNSLPLSKALVLLRREKRAKCSISSKPKKARSSTAAAIEASQRSYTHSVDLKTNTSMKSPLHARLTSIALRGAENNNTNTTKAKPKTAAKQTKSTPRTGESKGQSAKATPAQGSFQKPIKPAESCNWQRKDPSIEKPVQAPLTLAQASTQRATPKKAGTSIAHTLKRSRVQDIVGSSDGGQRKRPRVIASEVRSERGAPSVVPAPTTVKKHQANITKSNSQQASQQRGLANKLSFARPKNLSEKASKTHESTFDARSAQHEVHEAFDITAPHNANIPHSHQQAGSSISYQTPPQSSIESSLSPVSQKGSSQSQLPTLSGDGNQLPDGSRQTVSAHTFRQDRPTLLPATAAAKAQKTSRAAAPSQGEITAAAAQLQSIQARHHDTVPEASIIELSAPPATGLHQLDYDEADDVILSPQEAEKQKRLVDNRLRRIRREVNRGFPDKSEAEKEEICQTKSNQYFDKLTKRLRKNARANQGKQSVRAPKNKKNENVDRDIAVVAAAGRGPLVPVQLIKTPKKNERADRVVAAAAAVEPSVVAQSGVPALQALQSTQIITVYVVYISRPISEEKIREPFMTRTRAFGDLDKANHYAMQLLCGTPSQRAKKLIHQIDSWSVEFVNRLFVGRTRRSGGICVHVDVRKEQQVVGDMDPEILRGQYIDDGILQSHRKRYDVWEVRMIPKAWLYAEEEDNDEELEKAPDQQEAVAVDVPDQLSNDTDNAETAVRESIEEGGDLRGLEGRELVVALGKLSACDDDTDHLESSEQDPAAAATTTNEVSSPIDDDNRGDDYRRSPTPISAYCPFNPLDPYSDCEIQHIPYGSFTELPSANARAFAVARQAWKPRSCDIDAVTHWTQVINPCIQQEMDAMDMDRESAEIVCPTRPFHGVNSRRPWLFVHAKVSVVETIPEGPLDTEMGFEYDARPAATRTRKRNKAMQSQREREREMDRTPDVPPAATAAAAGIPSGRYGVEELHEEDARRDEDLEHELQLESDSDEGETSEEE